MKIIVTVDNRGGMLFGNKRQSRDRILNEDVLNLTQGRLQIGPFSKELFPEIQPDPDFLEHSGPEDWCFVENEPLNPWRNRISELVIYCWNRDYPATFYLDLNPEKEGWKLVQEKNFQGSSHEKITRRIYQRPAGSLPQEM